MTIYNLAVGVTASNAAPVVIADVGADRLPPQNFLGTQACTFKLSGSTTTVSQATFQWVGSLDPATTLSTVANGGTSSGGAWNTIGSATTVTCSTPGIAPAVTTLTSNIPYARYGVAVTALTGGGVASVQMNV